MSEIIIDKNKKLFKTAPDLYGLFFEDISRAGDGGLYPELIRNRAFEDSVMPEGCVSEDGGETFVSPTGWIEEFSGGEGMSDWVTNQKIEKTPVPGWYFENAQAKLSLSDTLSVNRAASLEVCFSKGGFIYNTGFNGIPQGTHEEYDFYVFLKASSDTKLLIETAEGEKVFASAEISAKASSDYKKYECTLRSCGESHKAVLKITAETPAEIRFGFISLMPRDTFMGHGLRRDLCEKLRDMHPSFLRFPGGCIVEGFTKETAMRFKNTIGPVWERPGHWLLWHYRTTNGLGFHEYLTLCEDLQIKALYVCNCGMTCQGRGPYFFSEEETMAALDDTLCALEYALGDENTKWGAVRAAAGHKKPFELKYLEIGNENSGPEYEKRYKLFREAVLSKYPELIIIANDRGRGETLEADIADDHYYNMPQYFAGHSDMYDSYDRSAPDVFVGEFSVNQTFEGQHRAAVAEAAFMTGLERNQDKIKLMSYAPLFENASYASWFPNLLIYNNRESYAIPTYYVWRMFGKSRGDFVLSSKTETSDIFENLEGYPMLCGDCGVQFKNVLKDGASAPLYRKLQGDIAQKGENGEFEFIKAGGEKLPPFITGGYAAFGETAGKTYTVEADIKAEKGQAFSIGGLCAPKPFSYYDRMNKNPRDPWMMFNLDMLRFEIKNGEARFLRGSFRAESIGEAVPAKLSPGYTRIKARFSEHSAALYIEDELIMERPLPSYPAVTSVATGDDSEIIVKIVNYSDCGEDVKISIGAPCISEYTAEVLCAAENAENSFAEPENVCEREYKMSGAAESFIYSAAPLSVNVLRILLK